MVVVVPGTVSYVRGEIGREALLAVALHEIDDVVRHQGGEPADAVAHLVPRSDMGGGGDHDRARVRIATCLPRALAEQADAPADQAGIRELNDRAVGDAAGELERLRPVSGDPDGKALLAGPVESQRRPFVGHLASFAEVADDLRGFLEHREVRGLLSEDAARRVAAANAEVHAPARELLQDREHARGHGRFARRRVRHARSEAHPLGVLRHEREENVGLLPQDVTVEEPPVGEPRGLGEPRQRRDSFERVVRFEREAEVHETRKCRRANSPAVRYFAPGTAPLAFGSAAPSHMLLAPLFGSYAMVAFEPGAYAAASSA